MKSIDTLKLQYRDGTVADMVKELIIEKFENDDDFFPDKEGDLAETFIKEGWLEGKALYGTDGELVDLEYHSADFYKAFGLAIMMTANGNDFRQAMKDLS